MITNRTNCSGSIQYVALPTSRSSSKPCKQRSSFLPIVCFCTKLVAIICSCAGCGFWLRSLRGSRFAQTRHPILNVEQLFANGSASPLSNSSSPLLSRSDFCTKKHGVFSPSGEVCCADACGSACANESQCYAQYGNGDASRWAECCESQILTPCSATSKAPCRLHGAIVMKQVACALYDGIDHPNGYKCCDSRCGALCGSHNCQRSVGGERGCCSSRIPETCNVTGEAPCMLSSLPDDVCTGFNGSLHPNGRKCCGYKCGHLCGDRFCARGFNGSMNCCDDTPGLPVCSNANSAPCVLPNFTVTKLVTQQITGTIGMIVANPQALMANKAATRQSIVQALASTLSLPNTSVDVTQLTASTGGRHLQTGPLNDVLITYQITVPSIPSTQSITSNSVTNSSRQMLSKLQQYLQNVGISAGITSITLFPPTVETFIIKSGGGSTSLQVSTTPTALPSAISVVVATTFPPAQPATVNAVVTTSSPPALPSSTNALVSTSVVPTTITKAITAPITQKSTTATSKLLMTSTVASTSRPFRTTTTTTTIRPSQEETPITGWPPWIAGAFRFSKHVFIRFVWGPYWAPERNDIAVHYSVCEEVQMLKPYWAEFFTNLFKIVTTLVLFGPPTEGASANAGFATIAGEFSFNCMALTCFVADCREIYRMPVMVGWRGLWGRYQCSAVIWVTSPNFASACAAFALWYLAHVRLNYYNSLPYADYSITPLQLIRRRVRGDRPEARSYWFARNIHGWRFAATHILLEMGKMQTVYVVFLTVVYIMMPLLLLSLTHLIPGFFLYIIPTQAVCILAEFLGEKMASFQLRKLEESSNSGGDPFFAQKTHACEIFEHCGTEKEKKTDCAIVDESCRMRIRAECDSEGMSVENLRKLSDSDLRLFLVQIRYPFSLQSDIVERTRYFRSSASWVVSEYMEICRRSCPMEPEQVEQQYRLDHEQIQVTGAPKFAWRTYFFLAVAGSVLVPALVLTMARFWRGDGFLSPFWNTATERTSPKYLEYVVHLFNSKKSFGAITLIIKQVWSCV